MSRDNVSTRREGHVMELRFERPEAKNALTLAMYEALVEGLEAASADASVRVVVLRGAGGNFTSGNDLNDFAQNPPVDESSPVFRFLQALIGFEKPIVAGVEGFAIGIGTTMLMHCDLVYAAQTARFQLPFVNLALVPEAGSSLVLPRMLGHQKAAELLFFGERFGAVEAKGFGLVNEVYAPEEFEAELALRVGKLAEQPPAALRETKRLMRSHDAEALQAALRAEAAVFAARLRTPEFSEALSAFFEKRKPRFE